MFDPFIVATSALAQETIVERKGEDRLDRQVHHVIHHGVEPVRAPEPETEAEAEVASDVAAPDVPPAAVVPASVHPGLGHWWDQFHIGVE